MNLVCVCVRRKYLCYVALRYTRVFCNSVLWVFRCTHCIVSRVREHCHFERVGDEVIHENFQRSLGQRANIVKMWTQWVVYILYVIVAAVQAQDLKSFDDNVLFNIRWPEKITPDLLDRKPDIEPYFITTADNERYQCLIPDINKKKQEPREPDLQANLIFSHYLSWIFTEDTCSYKLDSYWTYELCHGKFVRQYHEERDGKKVKTQEYYLGNLDKAQKLKMLAEYEERIKNPNRKAEIPVKKVDGLNMPYLEVEMDGGTVCDLNNKPRKIKVLYVCFEQGKQDIFSLKETSSCEYEAIVFTPYLCVHPDYKSQDARENEISCMPVDDAPKRPKALHAMEAESIKLMLQKPPDDNPQKVYAVFHVDNEGQDGVRVEMRPLDVVDKHNSIDDDLYALADQVGGLVSPAEITPVQNFLNGEDCLHGGNGWWKYEFCIGRSVVQYHVERDGTKTIINLGNYVEQAHLDWIAAHPHKKVKPPGSRTHFSHFYSGGTICDKTGNPRQTEVTFKCVESHMASPSGVSLFLLELKTCEYVLGVESPLICDTLEYVDENGLMDESMTYEYLKTIAFPVEQNESEERIANDDD